MNEVHVIRHAKAKNRLAWDGPDDLRPLTKRGRREAAQIAARLGDERLTQLLSSPAVRCVQTLEPLASALDLRVERTEVLAEGADGAQAAELLLALAEAAPIAACTHGDVVFELIRLLSGWGVAFDMPAAAPVAATWTLTVADGRFVEARFRDRPTQ